MDIEKAIKELRDSYELKHREWAYRCLDTIQEELEKKDKIIELMAEELENLKIAYFKKEDGGEFFGQYRTYNKNDWKQYFEKKVEGK